MADGPINTEGFRREKTLFDYKDKGDVFNAAKLNRASTAKRQDRPSPDNVPYTNTEKLTAMVLPRPDQLISPQDVTYEKKISVIKERQVGYSVTEIKGVDYSSDDIITLVGFHGAMGSDEVYQNFMRMFEHQKVRLISVSAPCHGDTFNPKGQVDFESWMKDYVVPLLKEQKAEHIISLGSSMGGLEALWLTKLMPKEILGSVIDNPLIDSVDSLTALRVVGSMAVEGLVHKYKEGTEINREQFYKWLYPFVKNEGFNKMKKLTDLIDLAKFLKTIPKSIIGDLDNVKKVNGKDPDIFVFTGRHDNATKAHERREEIASVIREIKAKVFGVEYKQSTPENPLSKFRGAGFMSFRGGHMNGFDRPWEYYAANYNAIKIIMEDFENQKTNS